MTREYKWGYHRSIYFSYEIQEMIKEWQETHPGISFSSIVREAVAVYFKLDEKYVDSLIDRNVHPRT